MKKTTFTAILMAAFFCFVFPCNLVSCASTGVPIPGKTNAEAKKLSNEYLAIADLYFGMEKYDKAIEYYKLALNNKDNYWNVYYKLARTYTLQSKWNDALPMYENLLKRDPDNNSLKVSIAYIYAMSGDTDKAVKIYSELVEKNPENDEYLQNLIAVYIAKKDYETSVKYFETFQQTFPDNKNGEKIQQELEKLRKELYPDEEVTEEGTEEK